MVTKTQGQAQTVKKVLTSPPVISNTQEAIGEAQMGERDMQLFTQNPDGTRTESVGFAPPTMRLIAFSHESLLTDFSNGARRITSGRLPQVAGEAVVSQEFATLNNLSVGSTIEIANFDLSATDIMRLTVVGIYHDGTPEFPPLSGGLMMRIERPSDNRRNEIIIHFDTLFNHPQFVGAAYIRPVRQLKDMLKCNKVKKNECI